MEGILAPWHRIIIIVVVMLVFGPKKLPELGNSLGKGISGFRRGMKDVQDDVTASMAEAPESTASAEATAPAAPAKEPVLVQSAPVDGDDVKP